MKNGIGLVDYAVFSQLNKTIFLSAQKWRIYAISGKRNNVN